MPKRERKGSRSKAAANGGQSRMTNGGTRLSIRNSGQEVWLYDDANREALRGPAPNDAGFGGMPPDFNARSRQGLVVGYSLVQDDDLAIAIHVGDPLTQDERSVARWLEPQRSFLRLPSGNLCVESNDASRIGPETPTETGAQVKVPPGNYGVTLYRIDHEALFRERLTWNGPLEVIVLTPGGDPADAADDFLPFEERRDTNWIGKYTVEGQRAEALIWVDNYWDGFMLNLDSTAAAQLSLAPGSYFKTHVPAIGLTLHTTFAKSWDEAQRFALPEGNELTEYGYGALHHMQEWNGAEALWCRRETCKTRIENEYHGVWTPAVVEVLGVRPEAQSVRGFTVTKLGTREYFDAEFLTVVASDVLPEAEDADEFPLIKAVSTVDWHLGKMGLTPKGDFTWEERERTRLSHPSCRLYAGHPNMFAALVVSDGSFEVVFYSEMSDGNWIVTGFADEIGRRILRKGPTGLPVPHPNVQFQTMDESLAKIFSAHTAALSDSERQPIAAPTTTEECVDAFARFLKVAFQQ